MLGVCENQTLDGMLFSCVAVVLSEEPEIRPVDWLLCAADTLLRNSR